jgi:hypothetical protein
VAAVILHGLKCINHNEEASFAPYTAADEDFFLLDGDSFFGISPDVFTNGFRAGKNAVIVRLS